jgi:DNA polymerase-1
LTQLLIDGDLFLYKACAAAEYEADMGDDVWFLSTNLEKARDMWESQMEAVQRTLGSEDLVIVLSGAADFRRALDPTYKANRRERKPLGYTKLKEWLHERYPGRVVSQPCLEADDYLGILATTPNAVPRIIVSDDKDMLTIPGKLYRLGTLTDSNIDEADYRWLHQTLTGDSADGYKGCPGVGAVKADAILGKPGDRWENVRLAFLKGGMTEDFAVLQARLARILRFADWDSTAKQPRLWSPPS